jgi:uncharacterized protein involved in type VI secretion and phage assembly
MELPPEVWCHVLQYLDLEKAEQHLKIAKLELVHQQGEFRKTIDVLESLTWRMEQTEEELRRFRGELENTMAVLERRATETLAPLVVQDDLWNLDAVSRAMAKAAFDQREMRRWIAQLTGEEHDMHHYLIDVDDERWN